MGRLKKLFPFLFLVLFFSCGHTDPPVTGQKDPDDERVDVKNDTDPVFIEDVSSFLHVSALHKEVTRHKATVIIFLSSDCPLCLSYAPVLQQLKDRFSKDSISFLGVFPGQLYTGAEIRTFYMTSKSDLTLCLDKNKELALELGATITPEVFVLDRKGNTLYSGRIDNWAYEVGKKRTVVTEHELEDALIAIAKGEPVKVKHADAAGCFIEKEK
jgi:thiol-disulfide isomerase/thioredoxin